MSNIIISILSLGIKPLYDKNVAFYKIIKDFREKLPRLQNQARLMSEEEINNHPLLHESFKIFAVINTSCHKTTISEGEIDIFYNKLNDFDFSFIFFKKHYKDYTRNLNRFNPKAQNKNFDLIILQKLLNDEASYPLKLQEVLLYHLKWKFNLTSKIYLKIKNRNKVKRG